MSHVACRILIPPQLVTVGRQKKDREGRVRVAEVEAAGFVEEQKKLLSFSFASARVCVCARAYVSMRVRVCARVRAL